MPYKSILTALGLLLHSVVFAHNPPGTVFKYFEKTFQLHPINYGYFLNGQKPDSAVLVFRQVKEIFFKDSLPGERENQSRIYYFKTDDFVLTPGAFYIRLKNPANKYSHLPDSLKRKKQSEDYARDTILNRRIIAKTVELADVAFFRCYYKNASGTVYKYQDISSKGKLVKECLLTDPATLGVEIQKFYESGSTSTRTQYVVAGREKLERQKFDSLWFDLNPKLVKTGRDDIYYPNQTLRLSRFYNKNILKDTVYTEYYYNGTVKKIYSTRNGFLDGRSRLYSKDNKLLQEHIYQNGRVITTVASSANHDDNKKAFFFSTSEFLSGLTNEGWGSINTKNDIDTLTATLLAKGFKKENIHGISDKNALKPKVLSAFNEFTRSIRRGDIVFVHFSGHGSLAEDPGSKDGSGLSLIIPCYDSKYCRNPAEFKTCMETYITQQDLEEFITGLKTKTGKTGQVYLSLDVSHAGSLLSFTEETSPNSNEPSFRGESNNLLFNLIRGENAPVFIYTATTKNELGFEAAVEGKAYGAYSLGLASALSNPMVISSTELYEEVVSFLKVKAYKQNPGYLASETQFLFEESEAATGQQLAVLPALKQSGNSFVLSVGISNYNDKSKTALSFKNCEADARAYASFFRDQFEQIADTKNKKKLFSTLLINRDATKDSILAAINDAISNTNPEDYFVFNFSGYCKPLRDSTGKQVTYFVPYGLNNLNDSLEVIKKGIPLNQLKELFQMIPANNQLFITEAGSTDDFQKEFIQALIETSPSIASLSNKNRIFIVPKGSGLDKFTCNNIGKDHGPINYFVTNLSDELNIFGLFEGGIYKDAVKFALNKTEVECDYFRTEYFDIFFEREFISSLRYLLPAEMMQSRGLKVQERDKASIASTISKRYALVVGTDSYSGKPDWKDLSNPVLDAKDIARELQTGFGFTVIPLYDKPADSIYESIVRLSKTLQPRDQLIIYIAGHGDFDERLFDDGFIVCADSKPSQHDSYRNTYIQYSKLSRMINKLPAQQVIMILDVCFGGTFDERVIRNQARSKTDNMYDNLSAENYFAEKLKKKTRLYLTSGGKKEVPDGYAGKHSPFAQKLIECLQTRGGTDKILTSTNFYEYVKKLRSGPLLGSFGDDEPGSEFIILAK